MIGLTVDELAQQAGTSVRTVRLYQQKGLLRPGRRAGRSALYDSEHLDRLRLVLRLIDRGYSLAAIKEMLHAWDDDHGLGELLGVADAARPSQASEPVRLTLDELRHMLPDLTPDAAEQLVDMGLLVRDGEAYLATTPAFLAAGASLAADGIPLGEVMRLAEVTLKAADALLEQYFASFLEHVVGLAEAGSDRAAADIAQHAGRQAALIQVAVSEAVALAMQRRTGEAITGITEAMKTRRQRA